MPRSKQGLVRLLRRDRIAERIVGAFEAVDRSGFVPAEKSGDAYADRPVALPEGQTTSQPSLIARMIEAADPRPHDKILEVGTGYGFQTALLARLAERVVSIERFDALAQAARTNLENAGITNAVVIVGDGWEGVPAEAPFDSIVVSAAATKVPPALADQLADGGRLVIPVRAAMSDEVLLFRKSGVELEKVALLTPARFVPLIPGGVT